MISGYLISLEERVNFTGLQGFGLNKGGKNPGPSGVPDRDF